LVSATWDWENVAGRLRDIYTEISTASRVEKGWGVEEETGTKPRIRGGTDPMLWWFLSRAVEFGGDPVTKPKPMAPWLEILKRVLLAR